MHAVLIDHHFFSFSCVHIYHPTCCSSNPRNQLIDEIRIVYLLVTGRTERQGNVVELLFCSAKWS